jgi:uncharacterized protein (DUF983 family)
MAEPLVGHRQVFDVRAAFVAGIVGTLVFAITMMGLDAKFSGSPWVTVRSAASLLSGDAAFAQLGKFDFGANAPGWLVYLIVGVVLAFLIALLLHRFGLIAGIIGGGILGFCTYVLLYFIVLRHLNNESLTSLSRWTLEVGHVVYGAVVGGVYEWLERARYVRKSGGL